MSVLEVGVPICAACRCKIGRAWQVTDGKVFVLCDGPDCTRWASIRGMKIVRRSADQPVPREPVDGQGVLFVCGRRTRRGRR